MLRRIVLVVGLITMLVGALLDRRGLGPWDLDRRLDLATLGVVAVVLLAGLLSLAGGRRLRVAGTALAVLGLVGTGAIVVVAIGTGLPGPSTGVLAVGSVVVGLAALVGGFVADSRPDEARPDDSASGTASGLDGSRRRRPARALVIAAGTAVLVASLAVLAARVVVDAPVEASTAPGAVSPAPVPERPTAVAWTWTADEGVREVAAAGNGVVVADDHGVTALDGSSGAPRWGFHRAGAGLATMLVSPDRATVVLVHRASGYGDDDAGVLTILDAASGTRRAELTVPDADRSLLITDRVVATYRSEVPSLEDGASDSPSGDDAIVSTYTALDLATGTEGWRWTSPADCIQYGVYPTSTRTTLPIGARCGDRTIVFGLDETSGRERWRLDAGPASGNTSVAVRATSDGSAVVALGTRPYPLIDTATGAVLTRITGGYPAFGPGEPLLSVGPSTDPSQARLDPATGTPVPLPAAPCADRTAAVVGSSSISVCGEEGTASVDGGPTLAIGRVRDDGSALDFRVEPAGVRVVPAPGAVVVTGTAEGPTVVRGLR